MAKFSPKVLRSSQGADGEAGAAGGITPGFVSSDQTVTVDTLLTVAHGLAGKPVMVKVTLKCTTDDLGYSSANGDEVAFPMSDSSSGSNDQQAAVSFDATNVEIIQGASINLLDKGTFNTGAITTTSWRWVIRAWL